MRDLEELARIAVDTGYRIHRDLGPGMLGSVYSALMLSGLRRQGLPVEAEQRFSLEREGVRLDEACRVDRVVDGRLLIQLKSVERLAPVHGKQLLTYLRVARQPLGLLMNFGAATFWEGVQRVVNNYRRD